MVVSDATRAHSMRDKTAMTDAPATLEVQDDSESSWANPHSVGQRPPKWEAYVTVDALKNFMTTMSDTFLQQVTEQVKKTREVVHSMSLLPTFDYVPTTGCEPSHRHALAESLC